MVPCYEPDANPAYQEMAWHYGVGVLLTSPYKPRDKAKVEAGVLMVERWMVQRRGIESSLASLQKLNPKAEVEQVAC